VRGCVGAFSNFMSEVRSYFSAVQLARPVRRDDWLSIELGDGSTQLEFMVTGVVPEPCCLVNAATTVIDCDHQRRVTRAVSTTLNTAYARLIPQSLLGPFHGAIAIPSVTRCRCRRCRRCGHRCAGGVRQYSGDTW